MEAREDALLPATMTLMGGPIDTRINPTAVNTLAHKHDLEWFKRNVIMKVPFPHPGFFRDVYPGFLQISGFLGMNLDRHMEAHRSFFRHLVEGANYWVPPLERVVGIVSIGFLIWGFTPYFRQKGFQVA